jgi:hypothetical protein
VRAQEHAATSAAETPNRDTSYIDENSTAHVTRVVPVPEYISPEERKDLAHRVPDATRSASIEERRARMLESSARSAAAWSQICPTHTIDTEISEIKVNSFRQSTPTCMDCRLRCSLPAGEIICSAAQPTCTEFSACWNRWGPRRLRRRTARILVSRDASRVRRSHPRDGRLPDDAGEQQVIRSPLNPQLARPPVEVPCVRSQFPF